MMYLRAGNEGKTGEKRGRSTFFPKESRGQKFIFGGISHPGGKRLSPLEFLAPEFSTSVPRQNVSVENCGETRDLRILRGENKMRPRGRMARRGAGGAENLYGPIDAVDGDFAGKDLLLAAVGADDELAVGVHVDGRAAA